MTLREFVAGPAVLLDGAWPGDFTEAQERAYFVMLEDFSVEDVMRAVRALRRSRLRPSVGEIMEALEPRGGGPYVR